MARRITKRDDRNNSRRGKYSNKNPKFNKQRKKEVEVNIDRDEINRADLKRGRIPENDFGWYNANPQLVLDTCSIPFGKSLGSVNPASTAFRVNNTTSSNGNFLTTDAVPGVATISFAPSIAISNESTSPINLAARDNFVALRYSNSRNANYEAPDIMLMYICYDSAATFLTLCKKVYGIIKNNPYQNRYYPQVIIQELGFSYTNISSNLAQFREMLNIASRRLNRLAIPMDLDYIIRHQWMTANLFLDSDTPMAQTYQFKPKYFYTWVEGAKAEGKANYAQITTLEDILDEPKLSLTLSQVNTILNTLIDPLLTSQTVIENMAGDILKAYGAEKCIQLDMIDENFSIIPEYSKEVLSQIENLSVVPVDIPTSQDTSSFNITQTTSIGPGYLIYNPKLSAQVISQTSAYSWGLLAERKTLNFHWNDPTPADVMVATRLMVGAEVTFWKANASATDVTADIQLTSLGSEFITDVHVAYITKNSSTTAGMINSMKSVSVASVDLAGYTTTLAVLNDIKGFTAIQQFDWHPRFDLFANYKDGLTTTKPTTNNQYPMSNYYGETRDLDVYTLVSNESVDRMHEVAVLSLFDSPTIKDRVERPYKSN